MIRSRFWKYFPVVALIASLMAAMLSWYQLNKLELATELLTSQSEVPGDVNRIAERKAVYATWKRDFDELSSKVNEPLFAEVKKFLDQGTAFAVPRLDGTILVQEAKETDVFTVLVLLPADMALSPEWADLYKKTDQHGAASFNPHQNLMILRAEKISPLVRGLLLGHEGVHALAASSRNVQDQTDKEFCDEEAVAHRMELEVLRLAVPAFQTLATTEGKKFENVLRANRGGPIEMKLHLEMESLNSIFGPLQSDLDLGYRATMLTLGAIFSGSASFYRNENAAMGRLANYLCGEYKKMGIR